MDELNNLKGRCNCRYTWTHNDFDRWLKNTSQEIKDTNGIVIGKSGITKLLYNNVIVPKKVGIRDLLGPIIKRRK